MCSFGRHTRPSPGTIACCPFASSGVRHVLQCFWGYAEMSASRTATPGSCSMPACTSCRQREQVLQDDPSDKTAQAGGNARRCNLYVSVTCKKSWPNQLLAAQSPTCKSCARKQVGCRHLMRSSFGERSAPACGCHGNVWKTSGWICKTTLIHFLDLEPCRCRPQHLHVSDTCVLLLMQLL